MLHGRANVRIIFSSIANNADNTTSVLFIILKWINAGTSEKTSIPFKLYIFKLL